MLQYAQSSAQTILEDGTFYAKAWVHVLHVSFKLLLCCASMYVNCLKSVT